MNLRALAIVVVLAVLAVVVWLPSRGTQTPVAGSGAVAEDATSGPARITLSSAPPERTAPAVEPLPSVEPEVVRPAPEGAPQPTFPDDYHGLRDPNLLRLYTTVKKGAEAAAERLSDPGLTGPDLAFVREGYLQNSAYVALIQQQRLYHYFYGRRTIDKQVPRNTPDVVYHSTGMGDMQVTFELRRDEFPDLFATMDEMAKLRNSLRATREARRSR